MKLGLALCLVLAAAVPLRNSRHQTRTKLTKPIGCLFLHGLGQQAPDSEHTFELADNDAQVQSASLNYWGLYSGYNPAPKLCDIVKVIKADTITRGWDNIQLQTEYCGAITTVKAQVDKLLVFTHSMGNLIIAGGIFAARDGCNLIKRTNTEETRNVVWFGLEGPLAGSEITNWLRDGVGKQSAATGTKNIFHLINAATMKGTVELQPHLLPATKSLTPDYVSYESHLAHDISSTVQNKLQLNCAVSRAAPGGSVHNCTEVREIANEYMSGDLCGSEKGSSETHFRLFKQEGLSRTIALAARTYVPKFVNEQEKEFKEEGRENDFKKAYPFAKDWKEGTYDAFVPAGSCLLRDKEFKHVPTSKFYAAQANHAEGACMRGDGIFDKQKPCEWIKNMILQEKPE